jgi:hypothetical protein
LGLAFLVQIGNVTLTGIALAGHDAINLLLA